MAAVFLTSLAAAAAVTWLVSRIVAHAGVLDRPNLRSSHAAPTPTVGGLGLMVGLWAGVGMGAWLGCESLWGWRPFAVSSLVLLVLVLDEVRPMGRLAKLAVQAAAAAVPLFYGLTLDRFPLPCLPDIELGAAACPVTFLWLVAIQNVFNFMDGIDGIAGLEGFLAAGLIYLLASAPAPEFAMIPLACAGAAAGFLIWNRPPARVFMGDVGSHFLGILVGISALVLYRKGLPFAAVPLTIGAFLFDTGYTLVRRLLRGENITQAHRFHLYQRLCAMGWSHGRVDAAYGGLTLLFGGSAYLHATGNSAGSGILCAGGAILLVSGAVWVERRWRRFEMENRGDQGCSLRP